MVGLLVWITALQIVFHLMLKFKMRISRWSSTSCTIMKNIIFWDIMPCSPIKVHSYFRETCCFHLCDLSQARNQQEADSKQSLKYVPLKHGQTVTRLQDATPHGNVHSHHCENLKFNIVTHLILMQYFLFAVNKTNEDLRFSQRWLRRVSSSGIWRCVVRWVSTDVSGGTYRLHLQGRRNRFSKSEASHLLVCCTQKFGLPPACWFAEPNFSTLKMEAICSSETSVETQRTTRRHIPEDDTLQDKWGSTLKSLVRFLTRVLQISYVYRQMPLGKRFLEKLKITKLIKKFSCMEPKASLSCLW
jgi:hypothetical protein